MNFRTNRDQEEDLLPEEESTGDPAQESRGRADEKTPEQQKLETKLLRLQADFDNYRKRTQRIRADASDDQKRELLGALLPIFDNFVRALDEAEKAPELKPFLTGFEMIARQIDQFLRDQSLEELSIKEGDGFDPELHEAAGMTPTTRPEMDGVIAHELQKGYAFKESLLRPTRVIVYSYQESD